MSMKISIVIPSFNQAVYLEETLRSVLDQTYRNFEIIVIDGGSTDGSVEILKRYGGDLAFWISEPDRGQTDAINKGLARITGDVWSYLNSDDLLLPEALSTIAAAFHDPAVIWAGGVSDMFDDSGSRGEVRPESTELLRYYVSP